MKKLNITQVDNNTYRFNFEGEDRSFKYSLSEQAFSVFIEKSKDMNFIDLQCVADFLDKIVINLSDDIVIISIDILLGKINDISREIDENGSYLENRNLSNYERKATFKSIEKKQIELRTLSWVLENKKLHY